MIETLHNTPCLIVCPSMALSAFKALTLKQNELCSSLWGSMEAGLGMGQMGVTSRNVGLWDRRFRTDRADWSEQ